MAKLKFDVSGSDPEKAQGVFKTPPPGMYRVKLKECEIKKPEGKDRRIEAVFEIPSGEYKGVRLFEYINVESEAAAWKLDQFLQAFGITTSKKRKGTLDTDEIMGETIRVRLRHETYNEETRARIAAMFPLGEDEDDEPTDDDDDEKSDDSDDDSDDDDSDDDSDDGEAGDSEDDYDEWSVADLRVELKERDLEAKGGKSALIARLREDDNGPFDE